VKLDGIGGESTVRGHENETMVLSYEQNTGVRFRKPVEKGSLPLCLR
jgi:type VI protein secretion system component Hcp